MTDFVLSSLTTGSAAAEASQAALTSRAQSGSQDTSSGLTPAPADPLLQGLNSRLNKLASALENFSLPADNAWNRARLATADAKLAGKLTAELTPEGQSVPLFKLFSGGFKLDEPSGLSPGEYSLNLSQGTRDETLKVTVKAGQSGKEVLNSLASAINQGALAVRADVLYQNGSFELDPNLAATGYVLAVSVNPDVKAQGLTLSDKTEHLAAQLAITPTNPALGSASPAQYLLSGLQLAKSAQNDSLAENSGSQTSLGLGRHDFAISNGRSPLTQSYVSSLFDPTAASSLTPGETYDFSWQSAGETRNFAIKVQSGWSNGDVLRAVAANINGQPEFAAHNSTTPISSQGFSLPGISATLEASPIPSATQAGVLSQGQVLIVSGQPGQDYALKDGSNGLLASLGLSSKLSGQVTDITVQKDWTARDTYTALSDAINSSQSDLGAGLEESTRYDYSLPGKRLASQKLLLNLTQKTQRIGQQTALSDGTGGALHGLGLMQSQSPGVDGKLMANAREIDSANNSFSLDQGRLKLGLKSEFGEELPLKVTDDMDIIEKRLSDVINSYNDLSSYLHTNRSDFDVNLSARLQAPVIGNAKNLSRIGLNMFGRAKELWLSSSGFWSAYGSSLDKVRDTLQSSDKALIPGLGAAINKVRALGLESFQGSGNFAQVTRPLLSEADLLKTNRIIDLTG